MADEEEKVATVEDPPKPGAEGEQEPKAEEPTEETPEPEGGAAPEQEGEEEPGDALKAAIEGMDPEERRALYDTAYESLSEEEKDGLRPEAASEKAAVDDAATQRDREFQALMQVRLNSTASRKAGTDEFVKGLSSEEELFDSEGRKAKGLDTPAVTKHIEESNLTAQDEWHTFTTGLQALQVRAGLESHPIHGKLNADQKASLEKLGTDPGAKPADWTKAVIHIYLDAAASAAPDAIKAKALEDAEKTLNTKERNASLVEALNGRRKKKALVGGTAGGTFASMTEADAAYNKGEINIERYKELRKKFEVPDIAR